jgi:hypothetical protein
MQLEANLFMFDFACILFFSYLYFNIILMLVLMYILFHLNESLLYHIFHIYALSCILEQKI